MYPPAVFGATDLTGQIQPDRTDLSIAPDSEPGTLFQFVFVKGIEGVANIVKNSSTPFLPNFFFQLDVGHQQMLASHDLTRIILRPEGLITVTADTAISTGEEA